MTAELILRYRPARILLHILCYAAGRENWKRCWAGIQRELKPHVDWNT